jgi:plastocyanin
MRVMGGIIGNRPERHIGRTYKLGRRAVGRTACDATRYARVPVTVRLRLAVTAALVVVFASGLHLLGARTASAATKAAKPDHHRRLAQHAPTAPGTPTAHRTPRTARRLRAPAGRHNLVRSARHRATHAGGLVLLVRHRGEKAHAASDPSATIVDFSFSPATITIHVGDTITWTNVGKQPHTATADNHSFDTGVLRTGQSASHTFTTPGTYTYYCIVHPFMRGTVVVLANTTTTTTSTTTTPTTTPTATTASTTSTPGLPNTGLDIGGVVLSGLALTGLGFALRRRLS